MVDAGLLICASSSRWRRPEILWGPHEQMAHVARFRLDFPFCSRGKDVPAEYLPWSREGQEYRLGLAK